MNHSRSDHPHTSNNYGFSAWKHVSISGLAIAGSLSIDRSGQVYIPAYQLLLELGGRRAKGQEDSYLSGKASPCKNRRAFAYTLTCFRLNSGGQLSYKYT